MSNIDCAACTELRDYAPAFVQSGVTTAIATSLKNNTGLNASVVANHRNCEDLQDVNDCLIGRLGQELENYDVCDWKEFMAKFVPNIYETLKAMIMSDCGEWTRLETLCDSVDSILTIVGGGSAKHHAMTPTSTWTSKFYADARDPGRTDISQYFLPDFMSEIRNGAGCNANRELLLFLPSAYVFDGEIPPYTPYTRVENLAAGDKLGYLRKSEVVPHDMPSDRWDKMLSASGNYWGFTIDHTYQVILGTRGYVTIDGVTFNEDLASFGEGTMVMEVRSVEDNHGTGGISLALREELRMGRI